MPLAFVSPTNGFSFSPVYNVYSFILFLLLVNKAFDYILVQKEQLRLMKHFLSNNLSLYLPQSTNFQGFCDCFEQAKDIY